MNCLAAGVGMRIAALTVAVQVQGEYPTGTFQLNPPVYLELQPVDVLPPSG